MKKRLRILHLEDNPADAELVRSMLEEQGIDCTLSRMRTRAEFQAALDQTDFDLIISDFTLPQFDGLSALKMARQQRPATPFLFVSGTMGEEAAVESLKQGATDYVLKHRLSRLATSVERAVREAKERVERAQAEETLRMQAQVLESMSEGVLVIDDRGMIQHANPAAEQMFGYSHGKLQGRMLADMNKLSAAENQQLVNQILDQIGRQGHWTGEFENRKKGRDTSFFT
ncbi:MAG: hypothetical protein DME26_00760 [Verrucomicrobia bacterium]|nr:MAG: hypothetical protein DME26_00760 [Verrucomicrobiota bacterium]